MNIVWGDGTHTHIQRSSDAAVGLTEGPFVPHASEPPGVTALHTMRRQARACHYDARDALSGYSVDSPAH